MYVSSFGRDTSLTYAIPSAFLGSLADVEKFQLRMYKMKADMMCELVGVHVLCLRPFPELC